MFDSESGTTFTSIYASQILQNSSVITAIHHFRTFRTPLTSTLANQVASGAFQGGSLCSMSPPMALTARQVETTKPKEKDYKLSDERGLFLLVSTTGKRYWRMKYRIAGKEKKLSIGVYPEVSG